MSRYLVRRLLIAIPSLIGISIVLFTVLALARDIGFDAVDAGSLKSACGIDRLLSVWRVLAFDAGLGQNVAFELLRR